ncbi:MAG: hypothetical protein ACFFBP_15640 [Promethearchaeota archaeon]
MNIQTLNTLQDQSKERLLYLVENIVPKFTNDEITQLLSELEQKASKNKDEFIEIGKDKKSIADLSKLKVNQLKLLYQVFISREVNDRIAVKWRLYQFLKYYRGLDIKRMKFNSSVDSKNPVDLIIETQDKELLFMTCLEILDLKKFKSIKEDVVKISKEQNTVPDRIIIAPNKTYRNISLEDPIKIDKKEIIPELWVELVDDRCPFNGIDLILVDNSDLNLAGFNFTNMEDLLDYIYQNSDGGQISIIKHPGFFSEFAQDESEKELIWKGIMLKKNI